MKKNLFIAISLLLTTFCSNAQIISTVAGNGIPAYSGDGGLAIDAEMFNPFDVSLDSSSNLYIGDNINNRIRKVSNTGIMSTFAGNGIGGYSGDGGLATAAELNSTPGVVVDRVGNVYITDQGNYRIRKVDTAGIITTVAGNGTWGYSGDGGLATAAKISGGWSLTVDSKGNLYIADLGNNVIRKVDTAGIISTVAGNGSVGYSGDGSAATSAEMSHPTSVAVDTAGNIFISDFNNNVIRKVTALTGIITTIAGNGTGGYSGDGGLATAAKLNEPCGIAVDKSGNIYFADCLNNVIRKINTAGIISTVVGNGYGAGIGIGGYSGDGGLASACELFNPAGITFDAVGNMYIGDENNNVIRKVSSIIGGGIVCVSSNITFTDAVTGGIWSSTNGNASIGSTGIITGVTAGLDTIHYTVTNGLYSSTATATVTINPLPNAGTIAGTTIVCAGSIISLTDASTGGTWSVSNSNATISSGIVTGVTAGFDTIKYTVTNSCGTAIASYPVTINPLPVAGVITGLSTVCTDVSITLTDIAAGGLWSSTNGNATVSGGIVTGVISGIDTIKYIVINSCGAATTTKIVTINPSPNAGIITGSTSLCMGSNTTLSDVVAGGIWTSSTISCATIGSTGIVTGVAVGTSTISYTVSNSCGSAIAIHSVVVNPLPNAGTVFGATSVCAGSNITLSDAATGGIWTASNTNADITSTGVVLGMTAGIDTINYTITNSCGSATATKIDTIKALSLSGTITGTSTVCVGDNITLSDATTGGIWTSSATLYGTVGSTGSVTGIASGTTTISYAITNACGTSYSTKNITVNPLPLAGTITGASSICAGSTTIFSDTAIGGVWTASNDKAIVSSSGEIEGITTGADTITYTVTNVCGTARASKIVTINPLPNSGSISGLFSVCVDATITLTDLATGGAWTASNGNATVTSGIVSGISMGIDTIRYTVSNSCGSSVSTIAITINELPNAGTITGQDTVCMTNTISLTDAVSGGMWNSSNGASSVSSTGVVTGVNYGRDTIIYTVTNSCGLASATYPIFIKQPGENCNSGVNIVSNSEERELKVYPNPAFTELTISLKDGINSIVIINLLGQKIYSNQFNTDQVQVDVLGFPNGVYFVKVNGADVKQFVKQ